MSNLSIRDRAIQKAGVHAGPILDAFTNSTNTQLTMKELCKQSGIEAKRADRCVSKLLGTFLFQSGSKPVRYTAYKTPRG